MLFRSPASSETELAALRERLDTLEKDAAARAPAVATTEPATANRLIDLAARLETLERRPSGQGEAASVARDTELGARLAAMESRLAAAETAGTEAAELRTRLGKLQAEAETLTAGVAAVEHRSADDVRLIALVAAKAALSEAAREGAALAHELRDHIGEPAAVVVIQEVALVDRLVDVRRHVQIGPAVVVVITPP